MEPKLTNEQALRLLKEIQEYAREEAEFWRDFRPMTDEEVAEIEAAYEHVELSPEARLLSEQKRQEFMDMVKGCFDEQD